MKTRCMGKKVLLLAVCCVLGLFSFTVRSNAAESQGFSYEEKADGTLRITGYTAGQADVVIPEKLEGKTVSEIAAGAFNTKDITSVAIPETVTVIGKQAFRYCVNLQKVTVQGSGLTTVASGAFEQCNNLAAIVLPESVTTIEDHAFSGIKALSFEIKAITTSYGKDVFKGTRLKNVICKQSSTTYPYMQKLTKQISFNGPYFDTLTAKVNVGSTITLKLNNAQGESVWTSKDAAIATVDNGVVTGCKSGKTEISVTNSNETIRVAVVVSGLKISCKKATITAGFQKKLTVSGADDVVWSSANTAVASVNEDGVVKAVKAGRTVITATVGNEKYNCKVTVKANKTTISRYSANARRYSGGVLGFATIEKTKSGYTVKGHFINGTSRKVKGIRNMTLTVTAGNKVIAKKKVKDLKLNQKAHTTRALTYKFSQKETKKTVDLRKYSVIKVSVSGAKYYYKQTITVRAK